MRVGGSRCIVVVFGRVERWVSRWIRGSFPWYEEFIRNSGMEVHPADYASRVILRTGFLSLLVLVVLALFIHVTKGLSVKILAIVASSLVFTPFLYFVSGLFLVPMFKRSSRSSKAGFEAPYAIMYMAVLSRGLSLPHIVRLFDEELDGVFPYISRLARRIRLYVEGLGIDYLTALVKVGDSEPNMGLRDFLHGYVATVKAGGDVSDYVYEKAVTRLEELVNKIKASVNSMSLILYAYLAMIIFSDLALAILYLSTVALPMKVTPGPVGVNEKTLILVMGVGMPFMTFATIVIMDGLQYNEPVYEKRWYILLGATIWIPMMLVVLGYMYPRLPHTSSLRFYGDFIYGIMGIGRLDKNYYDGIMLSMSLLTWSLIIGVYEHWLTKSYGSMNHGIISFFRDLAEIKKTGLSLEKCLASLSRRRYGAFTGILRGLVFRMTIAPSLRKAVAYTIKRVPLWKTRMLLSLLRDSVEAGGGTSSVFDSIASFLEKLRVLEAEKKSSARTLMITPYIGGLMVIFSVISLVSFGKATTSASSYGTALSILLPLIALNIWMMGFVVGKASSGRTISGFKHSAALLLMYIVTLLTGSHIMGFVHIGGH